MKKQEEEQKEVMVFHDLTISKDQMRASCYSAQKVHFLLKILKNRVKSLLKQINELLDLTYRSMKQKTITISESKTSEFFFFLDKVFADALGNVKPVWFV